MSIGDFETERYLDYKDAMKNKECKVVNAKLYEDHILEFEKQIYCGRHYIREDFDEVVKGYKVYSINLETGTIKEYRYEERD